jgi:AraC-like DNA-binding protein
MTATRRKPDPQSAGPGGSQGLFRAILAGPGHTLADAFANLEQAPEVERIARHPGRDLLGARITLPPEEGEGYWEFTRVRQDLYVVIANFAYKDPRVELVPGDGLVQFNFKISGDMALAVRRGEPLRWNRPSLLLWAQPTGVDISEWTAASTREQFIIVSMRPEFLAEQVLTPGIDVPEPLKAFISNKPEMVTYHQHALTAQTFEIATRLINNPYSGSLALVYTETLALELLCSAVGSFSLLSGTSSEEYTEREVRCLQTARSTLMRQFAPAPTIAKLARSVGMSKSTLTQGFKAVFGETIFDFSLRCRMQHALTLMRDRSWSVAKVSEAVGYAHSTSFTTAFRRHFGMRPIDVRRAKAR